MSSRVPSELAQLAAIEAELAALQRRGRAGGLRGASHVAMDVGSLSAAGCTRAAFTEDAPDGINVDNVYVGRLPVGAVDAAVGAVAVGNFKDEGSAYAAAVAVTVLAQATEQVLPAIFDVPSWLRRVFLAVHERIVRLQGAGVEGRDLAAYGVRRDMRGVGASLLVTVALPETAFVAHVGECRSFVMRGGRPVELSQPHVLANTAAFRGRAPGSTPEEVADLRADLIVTQLLGFVHEPATVSRFPLERGERVVLGGPLLSSELIAAKSTALRPLDELAADLTTRMAAANAWLPATVLLIGANGDGPSRR